MKNNVIYTITPNPALDIGGTVDKLIPNEKNYVFDETRSAGGNGINAARIAHRLGAKVVASGFLGGSVGEEFKNLLDEEGIPHRFIHVDENTRINLTVSNRESHTQTRLSFPGPEINSSELRSLNHFVDQLRSPSIVVIGGSLAKGFKPKNISLLVARLRRKGILCLVDVPGSILKKIVSSKPFFIKPNLHEFQELVGKEVTSIQAVLVLAKKLTTDVDMICVSSVEGGAMLVTKNKAWFGRIPKVKVMSTLGAGDSMVGAISTELWKYQRKNKLEKNISTFLDESGSDLLRWGLAAACATLVKSGMTFGDKQSIFKFYSRIYIEELT